MRRGPTRRGFVVCLIVAAFAMAALLAPTAGAVTRHDFEGPITHIISRDRHTFRMDDHHRGIVRIKANSNTVYEHLSGFGALHKGLRVDVHAHRSNGRWIADKIDRASSH